MPVQLISLDNLKKFKMQRNIAIWGKYIIYFGCISISERHPLYCESCIIRLSLGLSNLEFGKIKLESVQATITLDKRLQGSHGYPMETSVLIEYSRTHSTEEISSEIPEIFYISDLPVSSQLFWRRALSPSQC